MRRATWMFSCLLVFAAAPARADTLPRKLFLSFDRCIDSFLEAGRLETREFSVNYECKKSRAGYACAPKTDTSSTGEPGPGKLTLTAKAATTGIVLAETRSSVSIRVSLRDGAGTASLADRISTADRHGSRFCSGIAATSASKLTATPQFTGTGIEVCDRLVNMYMRCDKIPQQSRDAFLQGVEQWGKAIEAGGDAARTQIEQTCREVIDSSRESFQAMGC